VQIQYTEDRGGPYRPGACNIGPDELARRRQAALVAGLVTALVLIALVAIDAPPLLRALVFPFLAGTIVAEEQARRRFCVAFGFAGIRNFGSIGAAESVGAAADRAVDRRAALVLVGYSTLLALVATLVFVASSL
jgi:hypothetical protein